MANESDGSYHIRLIPKNKPKPIPELHVEKKKEVKHDKKTRRE